MQFLLLAALYAEAVTMAVRALGYKNVVEVSGTWPTNYMTKAVELDLLDSTVGTIGGSTGAARGNVAVILWNMLNREMWVIKEENATSGVTYGKSTDLMLKIKFPQLTVKETTFDKYLIAADSEVEISLDGVTGSLTTTANDFYKYAVGEKVKVVYNKDNEILSMASIEEGKKLEGYSDADFKKDVEDALSSGRYEVVANTYSYVTLNKTVTNKHLVANLTVKIAGFGSQFVTKVNEASSGKYIVINSAKFEKADMDDSLVIIDGERATLEDVEIGMVLTEITVPDTSKRLFIASSASVEGTLTKIVGTTAPLTLTVDGEKYQSLNTLAYTELEKDYTKQKSINMTVADQAKKLKNQEARLFLNAVGEISRVEFDTIDDAAATSELYIMMTAVYDETVKGSSTYYVDLENEAGEKEACKISNDVIAAKLGTMQEFNRYDLVKVTFDGNDEITNIAYPTAVTGYNRLSETKELTLDGSYLYKDGTVSVANKIIKVTDSTVLVKIIADVDHPADLDKVKVSFETGVDAFVKTNKGVYVVVADEDYPTEAAYVVVKENGVASSDLQSGIIKSIEKDNTTGKWAFTFEDMDETYLSELSDAQASGDTAIVKNGYVIAFTTEEKDNGTFLTLKEIARPQDFLGAEKVLKTSANGRTAFSDNERTTAIIDLDETEITHPFTGKTEKIADFKVVTVDVTIEGTFAVPTKTEITSITEADDIADVTFDDATDTIVEYIGCGKTENVLVIYRVSL